MRHGSMSQCHLSHLGNIECCRKAGKKQQPKSPPAIYKKKGNVRPLRASSLATIRTSKHRKHLRFGARAHSFAPTRLHCRSSSGVNMARWARCVCVYTCSLSRPSQGRHLLVLFVVADAICMLNRTHFVRRCNPSCSWRNVCPFP